MANDEEESPDAVEAAPEASQDVGDGVVVPINTGERSPYMVRRAIETYGPTLTDPKYASFAKLISEGESQIEAFLAINPHAEEWERKHAIAQASCLAAHPNIVEWRVAHALGAQDQLKAPVPACIKELAITGGTMSLHALARLEDLRGTVDPTPQISQGSDDEGDVIELPRGAWRTLPPPD